MVIKVLDSEVTSMRQHQSSDFYPPMHLMGGEAHWLARLVSRGELHVQLRDKDLLREIPTVRNSQYGVR